MEESNTVSLNIESICEQLSDKLCDLLKETKKHIYDCQAIEIERIWQNANKFIDVADNTIFKLMEIENLTVESANRYRQAFNDMVKYFKSQFEWNVCQALWLKRHEPIEL